MKDKIDEGTSKSIEAEVMTYKELLSSFEILTIPRYQRDYSWKKRNVKVLMDDIDNNEGKYFLGNLIAVESENGLELM